MASKETKLIVDCNVRVGKSAYGEAYSKRQCLRSMDSHDVKYSIISSFTPPDLSFEKSNSVIQSIVRENSERLKGAARIHPRSADSNLTLRKFLRKSAFVCIYLNPFEQSFKVNDRLAARVYEIAEETDSPVIVESGYPIVSEPLQVSEAAREFRKVKFVMTHAAQMLASGQSEGDSLSVLLENKNVYCDTSQVILSGIGGFIEQVVKSGGENRVLFGSNSPFGNLSVELMRVREANISEKEKDLILFENSQKLFRNLTLGTNKRYNPLENVRGFQITFLLEVELISWLDNSNNRQRILCERQI